MVEYGVEVSYEYLQQHCFGQGAKTRWVVGITLVMIL